MKTTLRLTLVGLSCLAMFIAKAAAATVDPPLSDLTSYFTAVSATPATTFEANRWYAVHNPYRGGYIKAGEDCTLSCAGTAVVDGDAVTLGADRLFRFVPTADGASTYYLQTGYGHYAKRLVNGVWTTYGNEGSATSTDDANIGIFTVRQIYDGEGNAIEGYFMIIDQNNVDLDADNNKNLGGWGTDVITSINGQARAWRFYAVDVVTEGELSPQTRLNNKLSHYSLFRLVNRHAYSTGWTAPTAAEDVDTRKLIVAEGSTLTDWSGIWAFTPSGAGYHIQNAQTAHHLPGEMNTGSDNYAATACPDNVWYVKSSASNTTNATDYVTLSTNADLSGYKALHFASWQILVTWQSGTADQGNVASDWLFEPVEDVTTEEVKAHFTRLSGYVSTPGAGQYYRLISRRYGTSMTENIATGKVGSQTAAENDYSQLWQLVEADGKWAIQNALTGRYLALQGGALSRSYTTTGTAESGFVFTENTAETFLTSFKIADSGGVGLHTDAGANVVGWYTNADASLWYIQEVSVDADALTQAQTTFQEACEAIQNQSTYAALMSNYFTDNACTTLQPEVAALTDAALTSKMTTDGLPSTLQEMVLKIKNRTWTVWDEGWDKTEESFRIADYGVYSDYQRMAWEQLKIGYHLGRLSNPTGIVVKKGTPFYVFADQIPEGASVKIELQSQTNTTGLQYDLTEGLNIFLCGDDATLYVFYQAEFVDDTPPLLSGFPDIKVHIEGGEVNGYLDLTRGDDNADWLQLQAHLLSASPYLNIKSRRVVFSMRKAEVVSACPEKMVELCKVWNKMVDADYELMAVSDFDGRFNNILNAFTVYSENAYMYATNGGTYYNANTLSTVMNYETMAGTGGAIWGPAHETGHVLQHLINMGGLTEVSNNLFSNVAVYHIGRCTSRAASIQTTFDSFAAGTFFKLRNIWEITHFYYQLYLFFHVQGYDPDFYPNLFRALRQDPINNSKETFVPASEECLKFYKKCCEVSGYDLTEFFEAYGFFFIPPLSEHTISGVTKEALLIDDYANYYLTFSQDDIDAAKQAVADMNLKPCNIIFIEDRITAPDATYEGAADGEKKTAINEEEYMSIGLGDVGQYTDYTPACQNEGMTYTYETSQQDGATEVTMTGEGAMGYKVYDAEGHLVMLANTNTFTLPDGLTDYVVKAAQSDGTDVSVPSSADSPYTLTAYYGSPSSAKTLFSDGTSAISLPDGAVAWYEGEKSSANAALLASPGVVYRSGSHYVADCIALADKVDFYPGPSAFTAAEATYSRTGTALYNSFCLPFTFSASDLPEGSTVETLSGFESDSEGITVVHFATTEADVAAGTPCLVWCPEDVTSLVINKTNAVFAPTPSTAEVTKSEQSLAFKGSYTAGVIGADRYKLNAAGTKLGRTTAAGRITPFRAWLELSAASSTLRVSHDTPPLTGINSPVPTDTQPVHTLYDLQGRRINQPQPGRLYIQNGKKVIY